MNKINNKSILTKLLSFSASKYYQSKVKYSWSISPLQWSASFFYFSLYYEFKENLAIFNDYSSPTYQQKGLQVY